MYPKTAVILNVAMGIVLYIDIGSSKIYYWIINDYMLYHMIWKYINFGDIVCML